jgi:hypothetical protein
MAISANQIGSAVGGFTPYPPNTIFLQANAGINVLGILNCTFWTGLTRWAALIRQTTNASPNTYIPSLWNNSNDNGITAPWTGTGPSWQEWDAGGAPVCYGGALTYDARWNFPPGILPEWNYLNGTPLTCCYQSSSSLLAPELSLCDFDFNTLTWGAPYATVSVPNLQAFWFSTNPSGNKDIVYTTNVLGINYVWWMEWPGGPSGGPWGTSYSLGLPATGTGLGPQLITALVTPDGNTQVLLVQNDSNPANVAVVTSTVASGGGTPTTPQDVSSAFDTSGPGTVSLNLGETTMIDSRYYIGNGSFIVQSEPLYGIGASPVVSVIPVFSAFGVGAFVIDAPLGIYAPYVITIPHPPPMRPTYNYGIGRIQNTNGVWDATPSYVWNFSATPPPNGPGGSSGAVATYAMCVQPHPNLGGYNVTIGLDDGSGNPYCADLLIPPTPPGAPVMNPVY